MALIQPEVEISTRSCHNVYSNTLFMFDTEKEELIQTFMPSSMSSTVIIPTLMVGDNIIVNHIPYWVCGVQLARNGDELIYVWRLSKGNFLFPKWLKAVERNADENKNEKG